MSKSRGIVLWAVLASVALGACGKSSAPAGEPAPGAASDATSPPSADAPSAAAVIDAPPAPDLTIDALVAEITDAGPADAAALVDAPAHAAVADAHPKAAPPDAAVAIVPPDAAPVAASPDAAVAAAAPCHHAKLDTKLIAAACARGGQAAAKAEMKSFVRGAKAKEPALECGSCHSKLAPDYPLKPDGLSFFKKLGGT
jgi:hypothetical protein